MILAAGKATRLRPLTDNCPKCLMPLAGRPLIDWTLLWLRRAAVTKCMINLHYLPNMVKDHVGNGSRYNLEVQYSYEPELLGTAGAVRKVADFFADDPFYVIYSDNFSQWDLRKLREVYEMASSRAPDDNPAGVIAVHCREDVTSSGMVVSDPDDRIIRYVEKPKPEDVVSHYVNAGFYFLHPKVLSYIPEGQFYDFSYHVFPAMLAADECLYAVKMDEKIIGIDTIEAYERANTYAEELKERNGFPHVVEQQRVRNKP
jgi:NDP-sugar pyrophosphorylase family protein